MVTIELNFVTITGELPAGGLAVLDLSTNTEHRNAGVVFGESIEVEVEAGTSSRFLIRRTELQPGDVTCQGASAETVTASGNVVVVITPSTDQVVCTISLQDELPVTGPAEDIAALGALGLGLGAAMVGISRRIRD